MQVADVVSGKAVSGIISFGVYVLWRKRYTNLQWIFFFFFFWSKFIDIKINQNPFFFVTGLFFVVMISLLTEVIPQMQIQNTRTDLSSSLFF